MLLVLHHIADVCTQPSWLIENKKKYSFAIFEHVMIYAGLIGGAFSLFFDTGIFVFLWFFVGHYITDFIKYLVLPKMHGGEHKYKWIYLDQAAHYAQILIAFCFFI